MQINANTNIHIKTHTDLDAVASVVLLHRQFPNKIVSVEYNSYNDIEDSIKSFITNHEYTPGDTLIVTDISFSNELATELNNIKDLNVHLFDHHKTARRLTTFNWAIVDTTAGKSATEVVYEHVINKQITTDRHNFVKAVSAWDTWLLQSEYRKQGEDLNTLLGFIGKDEFVKLFTANISTGLDEPYSKIIEYLTHKKDRYVEQVIRKQGRYARVHLDGLCNQYIIIFATDYISEIGNKILDTREEEIAYVCVINPVFNSVSLRSKNDMDVSHIAKYLAGGGHKNAAGFRVDFTTSIEDTIDQILNHINY